MNYILGTLFLYFITSHSRRFDAKTDPFAFAWKEMEATHCHVFPNKTKCVCDSKGHKGEKGNWPLPPTSPVHHCVLLHAKRPFFKF